MKKLLLTAFILTFLLASCQKSETAETQAGQTRYFDVPALVNAQISALNQKKPELKKILTISGKKPEELTLKPEDWKDELQYFREIDINKKALGDAYTVAVLESESGKSTLYTLKPGISAPVRQLEVSTNNQNQVNALRAVCEQNNTLFYSSELREMIFNPPNTLAAFKITGVQKVALFDSLRYQTKGKIY